MWPLFHNCYHCEMLVLSFFFVDRESLKLNWCHIPKGFVHVEFQSSSTFQRSQFSFPFLIVNLLKQQAGRVQIWFEEFCKQNSDVLSDEIDSPWREQTKTKQRLCMNLRFGDMFLGLMLKMCLLKFFLPHFWKSFKVSK